MLFENNAISGFIYFDKSRLPFKPETRQILYFDISKESYGLTQHIDSHYDEIATLFKSNGFDFIFLPKILSLFQSEWVFRYLRPDASENEIMSLMNMMQRNSSMYEGLSILLRYLLTPQSGSYVSGEYLGSFMDHFPSALICYAGERYDTTDGYAFHYMPFDKYLNENSPDQYQDIVEHYFYMFIKKMWSVHYGYNFDIRESICKSEVAFPDNSDDIFYTEEDGFARDIELEKRHLRHSSIRYSPNIALEPEAPREVAEENFSTEVRGMLTDIQETIYDLMNNKGVSGWIIQQYLGDILQPTRTLSHLHIRGTRIFLTDYNNMEITMGPLPRAVFFLFLRHSDGIPFSHLPDYREELLDIYSRLTNETDKERIRQSVEDVTNPLKNSINENASRIRRAFVSKIEPELAKHYFITGERGEAKKIMLDRSLVVWESDIIKATSER